MAAIMSAPKGCDLCSDWPVEVRSGCHPTAPLRAVFYEDGTLILTCYVPDCAREVWRGKLINKQALIIKHLLAALENIEQHAHNAVLELGTDREGEMKTYYRLKELQALPTLHEGHYDNLKVETDDSRVWLSRLGTADGMSCDNQVTVEHWRNYKWTTVRVYEGK